MVAQGAAQAQPPAIPPLFLPTQTQQTWGDAQGPPPPIPLFHASPTAGSMEVTGSSLEGSEYSADHSGQEGLIWALDAYLVDTAGAHLVSPPLG